MPRSPFTDILDLGIWMRLQVKFKRMYFLKQSTADALLDYVNPVWNSTDIDVQMAKVFGELNVVLCHIL